MAPRRPPARPPAKAAASSRKALREVDGPRGRREGSGADQRAKARSRRHLGGGMVATVLLVGVLFVGVFPTRTYLSQRAATQRSAAELRDIRDQRAAIERQRAKLRTDEEIERQARENLGYVKPGEEAYNILPTRTKSLGLPDGWPFVGLEQAIAAG
jgi:cell division protein FtsB